MQTYVSTIGYYDTRVVRPVLGHGVDAGDIIVLLRPHTDNEDGDSAVRDVRQIFSELGPDVEVAVERVTHNELSTAVIECVDILSVARGETIVNFGGGPREIFLPFSIATLVTIQEVDTVLQFTDVDQEVQQLELPDLMEPVSAKTHGTLRTIDELEGETTLPVIAERSSQSRSTVGRHLDELEAAEAVQTDKEAKTRHVTLTLGGRLRLFRFG